MWRALPLPGADPQTDIVDRSGESRGNQSAKHQRFENGCFSALDRFFGGQMQMGHDYLLAQAGNFQTVNTKIGLLVPCCKGLLRVPLQG